MSQLSLSSPLPFGAVRCYYRPLILAAIAVALLYSFWVTSRYPSLMSKAAHVGQAVPSMAYSSEVWPVAADAPVWQKIAYGAVNWLYGMKVGMSFGVLFGALLHTFLRYYPLKIGRNLYLNSLKGALVGVPMGVCANCAVPVACGVTRGNGRVETALGFLFSSPNFNPVVMMMTFAALPLAMGLTKYAILLLLIVVVVPGVVGWLERDKPISGVAGGDGDASCNVPLQFGDCTDSFQTAFKEIALDYGRNAWNLIKPTVTMMVLGSVVAAAMITLIPWSSLLSEVTFARTLLISLVSVFIPVPIALDVMFAAQLQHQGVAAGYVMLFNMTLGAYSIIPSIYLWRDVSKGLAAILFVFFLVVGCVVALLF